MPQRILVTGATGFVGGYLTAALRRKRPACEILGTGGDRGSHGPDVDIDTIVDLTDAPAVAEMVGAFLPDLVVHLAAQSSVATGLAAIDLTWRTNLSGSLSLALALARHAPEATVLFASTAEVYGAGFLDSPVDESVPARPMNPYAMSKAAAERMFADVLPKTARLIVARPFNHTGPGQRPEFALPSFAAQIAAIEASDTPGRVMVGNVDVRRDFLDVRDVVDAYIALIEAAPRLPMQFTVNIASGQPRSLRDLLEIFQTLSLKPFEIAVDPERLRAVDLQVAYARPDLLMAVTGWAPQRPMRDTLSDLLGAARRAISA